MTVVDVGSGAGFPLMELASRLGNSCKVYGVDPWINANKRAKEKITNYGLQNVELFECSAETIPLDDNSVDLVVSNLGINNFENPDAVLKECKRILKQQGKLVITTNLNGHWKEFYRIFEFVLRKLQMQDSLNKLLAEQEHRGTAASISTRLLENGFNVRRHFEDHFEMKFTDGSAFLNHHFVKLGWLASWKNLVPAKDHEKTFSLLEQYLNTHSRASGGLTLTVPMVFFEAQKI